MAATPLFHPLVKKEYTPGNIPCYLFNVFHKPQKRTLPEKEYAEETKRLRGKMVLIANQWEKELISLKAYADHMGVNIEDKIHTVFLHPYLFSEWDVDTLPIHYPLYRYLRSLIEYRKRNDPEENEPTRILVMTPEWREGLAILFCSRLPGF